MGRSKNDLKHMQNAMEALRQRLRNDPNGDPLIWPLSGVLAYSQRPLRDHPEHSHKLETIALDARPLIEAWIGRVQSAGIRSVICLLTPPQLRKYEIVLGPGGLLASYHDAGFEVRHFPVFDTAHPDEREGCEKLEEILFNKVHAAFLGLPKPVLLHCSAGIDRSSPVAVEIVDREKAQLFGNPAAPNEHG